MQKRRFPLWGGILAGYLAMGRPFAYLGVPPLFISEGYLAWQMLRNRHNWIGQFVDDVLKLEPLSSAIALNLVWGLVEVFRCLYLGRDPIEIFRTFALSYYPIYLLVGIAIGRDWSATQFVRVWKIVLMLYCPYTIFSNIFPDGLGSFTGFPGLSAIMPVTVLALWPYLRTWRLRHVAFLATCYPVIFISGNGRGWMLGLLAGIIMVMVASQMNMVRLALNAVVVLIVLTVIGPYATTPSGNHPLDPVSHAAKMIAAFDTELAANILKKRGYAGEADTIFIAAATAKWRQEIWRGAIHSLNTTELWALGQGGGASLREFVPDHQDVHTPHNFTVFCLYYVGLIGLVVFVLLLTALFLSARGIQDLAFRSMLQGTIAAALLVGLTSDCFETPYAAVPFYLLCGLLLGVGRAMKPRPVVAGLQRSHKVSQGIPARAPVSRNPAFAPRPTA